MKKSKSIDVINQYSSNQNETGYLNLRKEIYKIAYAHIAARALHIAAYYKIFDVLKDIPMTSLQIAEKLGFNFEALKALMMVLTNHDIISIDDNGRLSLNKKSELLVSSESDSLQPSIAKEYDNRRWSSLGRVDLTLFEMQSPVYELYGETFYEYLTNNKEAAILFNNGMSNFSLKEDKEIPSLYNFGKFKSICDVGGGNGSLMIQLIEKYPDLGGIILDLKQTILGFKVLNGEKYINKINVIGGNFFESVPFADAFILKRVIHNWDQKSSINILKNCVNSLNDKEKGRIFIFENIMPQVASKEFLIDINLMGMSLGGAPERNLNEFIELGKFAELEFVEKIDTNIGISLLVFRANI